MRGGTKRGQVKPLTQDTQDADWRGPWKSRQPCAHSSETGPHVTRLRLLFWVQLGPPLGEGCPKAPAGKPCLSLQQSPTWGVLHRG